ncbi:MAG: FHA domain-containing protein [Bryobacteraceae bacterium]
MSILRQIERRIDEKLRSLFQAQKAREEGPELIEIQRGILQAVGDKIQALPRGRRVFPYDDVTIRIPVTEAERRPAFELVFDAGALRTEIREYLQEENTEFPADLHVEVLLVDQPLPELQTQGGFHLVCQKRERPAAAKPAASAHSRFTIVHGQGQQTAWQFEKTRINIGRLGEILDEQERPVRRNDIVFAELDEAPNSTVSRAHAHIRFDAGTGEFRIFDDHSAYGTSVLHEGRLIPVPSGGARGVRLQPGDEIYCGQARLRFET